MPLQPLPSSTQSRPARFTRNLLHRDRLDLLRAAVMFLSSSRFLCPRLGLLLVPREFCFPRVPIHFPCQRIPGGARK